MTDDTLPHVIYVPLPGKELGNRFDWDPHPLTGYVPYRRLTNARLSDQLAERDARIAALMVERDGLASKLGLAMDGLERAQIKVSGGLPYVTAEAKHEQLKDADRVLEATLQCLKEKQP